MILCYLCILFMFIFSVFYFFFFKQKTAYEMRISDWSSDVCSSDLALGLFHLASPIGTLIGVGICGWMAAHYGWRSAIIAVSILGVPFALLLFLLVREPARPTNSDAATPPLLRSIREFFANPVLRLAAATAGLASFGTQDRKSTRLNSSH